MQFLANRTSIKCVREIPKEAIDMNYEKTKEVLNQAVADLSQFATIIHQTHWYMRGKDFLAMHPKMDEYMAEVNAQLDVFAERLITIGGSPYSTLGEFADNTKLKDSKGSFEVSMEDRVKNLLKGYRYLQELYTKGVRVANKEGDDVTEDLFISAKGAVETTIWMLSATLGKAPKL